MCSAVSYRNEMHRAKSAKELRELPADVEHVYIPRWRGSAKVEMRELERFPMLFSLDLEEHEIGAEGARALAESSCLRALTSLDLERNEIGADGARALAESSSLRALTSLTLNGNGIGNEGVRPLAESSCLRALTSLNLGSNQIDAEGFEH